MTPDDPRHGTQNGYNNQRCHCELCRAAHAAYEMRARRRRGVRPLVELNAASAAAAKLRHGTRGRYNKGCHCLECKAAARAYINEYRRSQRLGARS